MMAFLVFFALRVLRVGIGGSTELQHVKSTEFCLSWHIMEPHGKSLNLEVLCLLGRAPIWFLVFTGLGGLAPLGIAYYLLVLVRSGSAGA
jgi:hypothetical protein